MSHKQYDSEKEKLDTLSKQAGEQLIELSNRYDANMQKWSDSPDRPNELSTEECVGFITITTSEDGLNLVIDIQAPKTGGDATLRIWGIDSEHSADEIELFNNIQMDFAIDYTKARAIAAKGGSVTRDDIRTALNDSGTRLSHIILSNRAGLDTASQPLGERYDLTVVKNETEFDTQSGTLVDWPSNKAFLADGISDTLHTVLRTLENNL